jgi:PAS domain S-box-containing protein
MMCNRPAGALCCMLRRAPDPRECRGSVVTKSLPAPIALATYQLLFDASPAAVAIARLSDGAFVLANDAHLAMTGYTREELIGHGSLELGIWTQPEERVRMLAAVAIAGVTHNLVHEIRRKSGECARVAMSARIIEIDGAPHLLGILSDLSSLDGELAALLQSRARLREAEQAARFGFWEWDAAKDLVRWSAGLEAIVGIPEGSFDGNLTGMSRYIHPADLDRFLQARQASYERRTPFELEFRFVRPDGAVRWVSSRGAPNLGAQGELLGGTGISVDITEVKRREQQLQLQSQIMANVAGGVVLVNAVSGNIVFTNARYEQMLGYGKEELVGQHISVVNAPGERDARAVAQQIIDELQRSGTWHGEVKNRCKDGHSIWCRAIVSAFDHGELGKLWVGVNYDITETRFALQARDAAHAELRRLSAGVQESIERERSAIARDIHDQLGAVLTGIRMRLEAMARKDVLDQQDSRATLASVAAMAQAALASSRTICDRLRPPVLDDLGLAEACRWYLREWAASTGVRVSGRFSDPVPAPSPTAATDLFRIFQELLTNIARHAGAGQVRVQLNGGSRTLRLRVADDGCGFDPLQKTAGFGLVGVRERAFQHEGQVDIQSRPGGTTVVVTLISQPEAAQPESGGPLR